MRFFVNHKLISCSLCVSIFEIIMVWGCVLLYRGPWSKHFFGEVSCFFLVGTFLAFCAAIAALFFRSEREGGVLALAVAVLALFGCGMFFTV